MVELLYNSDLRSLSWKSVSEPHDRKVLAVVV